MRKILLFVMLLLETACATSMPSIPSGPILDSADLLSTEEKNLLEEKVNNFSAETGMVIKLVTVQDVSPYRTASEYTEALYHSWELGDPAKHNGLLLVIAQQIGSHSTDMKDYCRIMTGWGIQKILPDAFIINDVKHGQMMVNLPDNPFLAFDRSLDRMFTQIRIWKRNHPNDTTVQNTGLSDVWIAVIIIGIVIVIIIIAIALSDSGGYYSSGGSSSCGGGCGGGGGGCGGGGCGG